MKVKLFSNGNTLVIDNGQQRTDLQAGWLELYLEFLESKGVEPEQCEFRLPDGSLSIPFKTEYGWNWRIK